MTKGEAAHKCHIPMDEMDEIRASVCVCVWDGGGFSISAICSDAISLRNGIKNALYRTGEGSRTDCLIREHGAS